MAGTMTTTRRSFIQGALAALVASQVPAAAFAQDPASTAPAIVGRDLIIRVPQELLDDCIFDIEGFLQREVAKVAGVRILGKPQRLTELYAETGEVGFLFKRTA